MTQGPLHTWTPIRRSDSENALEILVWTQVCPRSGEIKCLAVEVEYSLWSSVINLGVCFVLGLEACMRGGGGCKL